MDWSHPAAIGRKQPALFPVRDWLRELDNRHGDRVQENIERERERERERVREREDEGLGDRRQHVACWEL